MSHSATRRGWPTTVAGAMALSGLILGLLARGPWPGSVRAVLGLASVLLGPALALHPWWRNRPLPRLIGRLAVLLALPLLGVTALGLAGIPLHVLALALPLASGGVGLFAWWRAGRPDDPQAPSPLPPSSPPARAALPWLAVAAVAVAALAAVHGTPLGAADDAFDHLATIRHLVTADRVDFPGAFYAHDPPVGQDPRKGVMHVGLALAAITSDVDPTVVWRNSAVLLAPLAVLAFAGLALALFENLAAALLAIPAFLLLWADPAWILKSAYGGHAALAAAWAITGALLMGEGWLFGLLAGLSLASVHAYGPAQLLAPLILFRVLNRDRGEPLRWASLAACLGGAIPVTILRVLLSGGAENPLHGQSMGWLMLGARPVASPLQLAAWYGFTGLAVAFGLALALPFRFDRAGRYLLATLLVPAGLLLNPWLFHFVADHFGSVANKLALVWAYPLAIVWLLSTLFRRRGAARLATLAGLLVILPALVRELPMHGALLGGRPVNSPPRDLVDAARLVERFTPPGAVIASEPRVSYALPALCGRRVLVTLHQHSPPGDGAALERLGVSAALFSECVPLSEALGRAVEQGAGWLLVPPPATAREDQYGSHADPRNNAALIRRFSEAAGLAPVAESGGGRLFRIESREPAAGAPAREWGAGSPAPPGSATGVMSKGVELAVEFTARSPIKRGEPLRIPAWWRRSGPPGGYQEYQAHVRFESERLEGAWESAGPFSKLLRRLVTEPREGGALRARGVELPFRGGCPVAEWPAGRWLADTLEVVVPTGMIPGSCRVRISLEQVSLYPRLRPADLFSNEDQYSGPTIARVEIE